MILFLRFVWEQVVPLHMQTDEINSIGCKTCQNVSATLRAPSIWLSGLSIPVGHLEEPKWSEWMSMWVSRLNGLNLFSWLHNLYTPMFYSVFFRLGKFVPSEPVCLEACVNTGKDWFKSYIPILARTLHFTTTQWTYKHISAEWAIRTFFWVL